MKGKLLLFALTGVLIMGSTVSFAADPAVSKPSGTHTWNAKFGMNC